MFCQIVLDPNSKMSFCCFFTCSRASENFDCYRYPIMSKKIFYIFEGYTWTFFLSLAWLKAKLKKIFFHSTLLYTNFLLLRRGRKITMNSYQKWFSYQATRFKDKGFQCAAPVFNSGRIPGRTGLDEWDTVETGAARRILFSPVHTSDERFPVVFLVILDPLVGFSTQTETSLHWSKQFIFYVQYNERNIQFR